MHPLATFISPTTQTTINTLVWTISVALQLALFLALFSRRIARRFPVFTSLIGFYLLRSVCLFFIFDHIPLPTYHSLYDNLQLIDLFLQAAVAIEIAVRLIRSQTGMTLRRISVPMALLALAVLATFLAAALLPPHAPIPTDRAQLFFSFLMILLFTWSLSTSAILARHIVAGFALYGIINLCASFGRTYAALHENVLAYAIWSYALAGIYLIVVLYWLLILKPLEAPASSSQTPSYVPNRS